tara:strand:- start:1321 stop:1509 length:189 start_codon:yes stop_codon:yes gene_type:complete
MPDCEYCGKPLKKIGFDRSNGRLYSGNGGHDWSTRKFHKKCFKQVKEEERIQDMLNDLRKSK